MKKKVTKRKTKDAIQKKTFADRRPLRFRAWDIQNKKWYKPLHRAYAGRLWELMLGFSGDLNAHTLVVGQTQIQHESMWPDRYIVSQFTGMLDKDSREIYEGDIVQIDTAGRCRVVYLSNAMKFYFETLDGYDGQFTAQPNTIKIIGNIWEN